MKVEVVEFRGVRRTPEYIHKTAAVCANLISVIGRIRALLCGAGCRMNGLCAHHSGTDEYNQYDREEGPDLEAPSRPHGSFSNSYSHFILLYNCIDNTE